MRKEKIITFSKERPKSNKRISFLLCILAWPTTMIFCAFVGNVLMSLFPEYKDIMDWVVTTAVFVVPILVCKIINRFVGRKYLVTLYLDDNEKEYVPIIEEDDLLPDLEPQPKKKGKKLSEDEIAEILKEEQDWRREQSGLKPIDYELQRIANMDGSMFEKWCALHLQLIGFETEATGKSGDQGVDIIAVKDNVRYAIQCKCYSSPIGNSAVQEVLGGMALYNCHVGVVMTNSTFTSGAITLAQKHNIFLWDQEYLKNMLIKESI